MGNTRSAGRTSRRFGTGSPEAIPRRSNSGIEKARSRWRHSPCLSDGQIAPFDPPPNDSGMIGLALDPQGRLVQLDAVPPQLEEKPESFRAPDWPSLFGAAGLDTARFASAEPQ